MSWFANMGWIEYSVILVILLMVSIAIGDYLEDILSWIKLQWKDAIPLKRVYIVVASIIGFALFILFCILYSQIFLVPLGLSTLELSDIDSGFALAFLGTVTGGVALFSGFLAILRSEENKRENDVAEEQSEIAQQQADTAEQGLITDRLNKATEGLGKNDKDGKPVVEVRLGALYALERIAKDSIRDHVQIMEIFCAYIRNGSLKNKKDKTENPTEDVQAALTIIGRRTKWPKGLKRIEVEKEQKFYVDLNHCYLYGAKLGSADLTDVSFIGATLTNAWFNNANLSDASLGSAILIDAWFENTILDATIFRSAETKGVHAKECNFKKCKHLTKEQVSKMFLGMDVKIPTGFSHPQSGTKYDTTYNEIIDFIGACQQWRLEQKKPKK